MSKKTIRVLIVDDSDLIRSFLRGIFDKVEDIEVIGEAENGKKGVEKTLALSPDIVTMDINMPIMGGLEAIENIMAEKATPILVISSEDEAVNTLEAVSRGALEFLPKGKLEEKELLYKVRILSDIRVITHLRRKQSPKKAVSRKPSKAGRKFSFAAPKSGSSTPKKIVSIASSTGGPQALSTLLSNIPSNFPFPIVVAQHIAEGFASGLATLLRKDCALSIEIGKKGDILKPGVVYIAEASQHMLIAIGGTIGFADKEPGDIYFPSCDRLLSSAAKVFKENSIGVILTGMGDDGTQGMREIKNFGGRTIAQDEETSTIFGMPKAAIESGVVDTILPIEKIGVELLKIVALN